MTSRKYTYNKGVRAWQRLDDEREDSYADTYDKAQGLSIRQMRALMKEAGHALPLSAPDSEVRRNFINLIENNNKHLLRLVDELEI